MVENRYGTPISNWTRRSRWSTSRWVERSRSDRGGRRASLTNGDQAKAEFDQGQDRAMGMGGAGFHGSLSILNVCPMCRGGPHSREAIAVAKSLADYTFSSAAKALQRGRFWQHCCPLVAWCYRRRLSQTIARLVIMEDG